MVLQAQMFLTERKLNEALTSAQAAVAANPQAAAAQSTLGDVFAAKSDPDNAMRAFNEVLKLNPDIGAALERVAKRARD